MSIQWVYPEPFTMEMVVDPAAMDGLGHTNNANYIIWCEKCAWQHSEFLGLAVTDYQALDRGVAIRHAEYDYFQPTFAGDPLVIGTWLVHCDGRLRIERHFQIAHRDTGVTILQGRWKLVSVVLSTGRVTKMPVQFSRTYSAAVVKIPTS